MAALPSKKVTDRMVIITQGAECTVVCRGGEITKYSVPKVAKVIDTTGAGDSFVGGYLSKLMCGAGEAECVKAGHYAAAVVIQRVGATYPSSHIVQPTPCKESTTKSSNSQSRSV